MAIGWYGTGRNIRDSFDRNYGAGPANGWSTATASPGVLKDASHTDTIKDAGITGADDGRVDVRDLILHAFRDDQRVRHSIFPQFEARGALLQISQIS